jgi:hypothetical protein
MIKPGYRTSEFWFTLVSFIFSGLYLTGIINDHTNKEELISVVSHAVESCILIGGQLIIVYNYIKSRQHVKEVELKAIEQVPENPIEKPVKKPRSPKTPPKKENKNEPNKPRTSTKRSRKTDSNN